MPHLTATKEVLQRVETANRRHRLFRRGDAIVVALSGGPDSTALLAALSLLRRKYALTLHAAHLDHGLTSAASGFAESARRSAERFGASFHARRVDVRALARRERRSLEDAGRSARYAFLRALAAKTKSDAIATAHTLDDQAETVLLRLVRGTGPSGLAGIPAKRDERGVPVVRPLLGTDKRTVLAFLRENRVPFRVDPSNRSDEFTRNRVRRGLLPYLEKKFNPRAKEALAGLAEACAETRDVLEKLSAEAYRRTLAKKRGNAVELRLQALSGLHPAVLSEVLFRAAGDVAGGARLSRSHVDALKALVASPEPQLEAHLPGIRARKAGRALRLSGVD